MSWILLILLSPIWVFLLYIPSIQYKRGGWWKLMYPLTLFTAIVDVVFNYTVWAVYTNDFPEGKHEITFSKRLRRLVKLQNNWGTLYRLIAKMLDYFDPTGKHV